MSGVPPLLEAVHVSVSRVFEDNLPRRIVEDVSLSVKEGEVLAVVGPSGSGKSTVLRLFNRLLEPESGHIQYVGANIVSLDPPVLRSQLPLVAQKPFLFKGTVAENLAVSAKIRRKAAPDLTSLETKEILSLCQVEVAWLSRNADRLSVGQQQRVCLARALFGPCRGLLLDEPTSALDRPTAEQLAKTFRILARQKNLAMIIVTHDLRVAELCADRIAVLVAGKVVEEGPAASVLIHPQTEMAKQFILSVPAENVEEGE